MKPFYRYEHKTHLIRFAFFSITASKNQQPTLAIFCNLYSFIRAYSAPRYRASFQLQKLTIVTLSKSLKTLNL